MTDLLAVGIVGGMAYFGWRRGTMGMLLLAGGLFGGYLAALILFRPMGSLLSSVTGIPGIVSYPLGGMVALFVVSALVSRFARRYRRERDAKVAEGWEPTREDGVGGAILGGGYGAAIAVIVSWASMSLGGLYGSHEMASVRESTTGRLSTGVVQRAITVPARAVVGDRFVASSMAHMISDPFRSIEALNGVMADDDMQSLLSSGAIREAARLQDARELARNPALQDLAADPQFASAMRTFGLIESGSGAADPAEVANAIVREAGPALRSIDVLMQDPEVTRVLESPAFRQSFEQGDLMRLAQGVEFRRLFDRVLEELRRNR